MWRTILYLKGDTRKETEGMSQISNAVEAGNLRVRVHAEYVTREQT